MKTTKQPFARSTKVYFFYSFLFGKLPLGEPLGSSSTKMVGEMVAEKITQRQTYARFEFHVAEEKEPLQFRSDVYLRFPHFSISPFAVGGAVITLRKTQASNAKTVECSITKHIAMFESGMGVMSVVVNPVGVLDSNDVIHIMRLGDSDSCCSLSAGGRELTPFAFFEDEIDKLKKALDEVFRDSEVKKEISANVEWIDKDRGFVKVEPESNKFQEAHVAVVLEVGSSEHKSFFGGKSVIDTELRRLLRKDTRENAVNAFIEKLEPPLVSVFPDERFILLMHLRVLLVCYEANKYSSTEVEDRILKGLFRTLVALRGTWHFYLITNEIVDQTVKFLYDQFERLINNQQPAPINLLEKEREIIKAKGEFLRNLGVEDPLLRAVGLSPFSSVFSIGSKLYRTEELKATVWKKVGELDSLFEMVDSYARRVKFIPSPIPPKIWLRSYFLAFVLWSLGLVSLGILRYLYLPLVYYTISCFLIIIAMIVFFILRMKKQTASG